MSTVPEQLHIESTPGTCGGAPRIAGSRIRVSQIVLLTESGVSPDELVARYPHLSLADVYAALAFYHDHRDLIDSEIQSGDEVYARRESSSGDGDGRSVSS